MSTRRNEHDLSSSSLAHGQLKISLYLIAVLLFAMQPVQAQTEDQMATLKYWAPTVYQSVYPTQTHNNYTMYQEEDFLVRFDFDKDWNATNQWDNTITWATHPSSTIYGRSKTKAYEAYAYGSFVESENYYFLAYYYYHTVDDSEPLPTIPTIVNEKDERHENDVEAVFMCIKKGSANGGMGTFQGMLTEAHKGFYGYTATSHNTNYVSEPLFKTIGAWIATHAGYATNYEIYSQYTSAVNLTWDIDETGRHPKIFIGSNGIGLTKGHEIEAYDPTKHGVYDYTTSTVTTQPDRTLGINAGIVYKIGDLVESSTNASITPLWSDVVIYDLLPFSDFWNRRFYRYEASYNNPYNLMWYKEPQENSAQTNWSVPHPDGSVSHFPSNYTIKTSSTEYKGPSKYDALATKPGTSHGGAHIPFRSDRLGNPIKFFNDNFCTSTTSCTTGWSRIPPTESYIFNPYQGDNGEDNVGYLNPFKSPYPVLPDNDVMASYTFDGTLKDETFNNFDGTTSSSSAAQYGEGREFQGLELSGSQYVTLWPANVMGLANQSFTVTAWVHPATTSTFSTVLGTDDTADFKGLKLGLANGLPFMEFTHASSSTHCQGTTTVPTHQWSHLSWVYDNSTKSFSIFVNGSTTAACTATAPGPFKGTGALLVGRSGGGNYFTGRLDNLNIYLKALSASQLSQLERDTFHAYYPFNGSARDAGPYALNGTLASGSSPINATDLLNNPEGAYAFDGTQYITLPSLSVTPPFTASVWAKFSSTSSAPSNQRILELMNTSSSGTPTQELALFKDGNYLEFSLLENTVSKCRARVDISSLSGWNLITVAVSDDNQYIVYLNDNAPHGIDCATTFPSGTFTHVTIGGSNLQKTGTTSADQYRRLVGSLDDLHFWTTVLFEEDVAKLYNQKKQGLVASYKFHRSPEDGTLNGFDGEIKGAVVPTKGRGGYNDRAYRFYTVTGSGMQRSISPGHIKLAAPDLMGLTGGSFSVAAWIKPKSISLNQGLYSVSVEGTVLGSDVPTPSTNTLRLASDAMSFDHFHHHSWANQLSLSSEAPADTWTHVVWVYNYDPTKKTGTQSIYWNGNTTAKGSKAGIAPFNSSDRLTIGRAGDGTNHIMQRRKHSTTTYFVGDIDRLQIFQKALSTSDIHKLYQNQAPSAKTSGRVSFAEDEQPTTFAIRPAYPNPFNPTTTVRLGLAGAGLYVLRVYDVLGRLIQKRTLSSHSAQWMSYTLDLAQEASGLYLIQLEQQETGRVVQTRAMLVK